MKLRMLAAGVLAAVVATVAAGGLSGQEARAPAAPRIGLVLSGGGARGAAHVGVLEVLEELHVPVHAIAGTSMGAVVGGLYAAGLGADRLATELAAVDWPEMLTDRLPRSALEYRRREEDREFLTQFELSVEGGIPRLPAGVVAGHNLEARLDALLLPTAGTRDFDDLPIPFRATATDLATGDLVVLEAGDLSLAIRASLSLPAVFAPVQLGDRLLVDGGVVRNLPVDVARAMGVDVLIVVDVGTPMVGREELRSLLDVSTQLMHILTQANSGPEREALEDEDVLLRPELGDLSILDFHRWEEAVLAGRQAALSLEGRLRELAVSPEAYAAGIERRRRASRQLVVVQRVRVRPPPGMAAAALRNLVHVEPGRPLDPARLEESLLRLHGLRLFERIHVRLEGPPDAATLVIEPEPKSGGIHSLRFGLQVVDDFGAADASYNVRSGLWLRNLNRRGGEARLEVEVGEPRGALLELFQPLAPASPLALLARGEHRVAERYLVSGDGAASSRYRLSASRAALELALHPGAATQLRAGVFVGRRAGRPLAPATPLEDFDDGEGGLTAALTMDRLDDAAFPHSGALLRLEWAGLREDLGTPEGYDRAEAALVGAVPVGRHTLILGAEAGARSPGFPAHDPYALGGLFRLSGQAGVADRLGGVVRVAYLHDLGRGRIYAGASAEAGGVWPRAREVSLDSAIPAGALLLGFRTLLGPVYVAGGYSRHGSFTAYVSVGRRVGQPW